MNSVNDETTLLKRIASGQVHVGVLGLGYVGLPLAVAFAGAGLRVTGMDIDTQKVEALNAQRSYIPDVPDAVLPPLFETGLLSATSDYAVLNDLDAVIICVPTPLLKTRSPDISYIVGAADKIAQYIHQDMLVVLESTTYPGSTEELILPRILATDFQVGENVFLAFSPERIDPGNQVFGMRNTPKVIGGITPRCTEMAVALYRHAVDQVVPVSSARVAEMVKLLENTFRAVNIGLVNEMALICDKLNLDVWEVVEAAATKPFGFLPFYPGPGLGGHCLPIDPLYLSWKLKTVDYNPRFIELADDINSNMPRHVVGRVSDALNTWGKAVNGAQVLVLGVAYKPNVNDVRESPAFRIIRLLMEKGAQVAYHDPYVPRLHGIGVALESIELTGQVLGEADCVLVVTDHSDYDWQWVAEHARLVVDTRNALSGVGECKAQVVKL